VNGIENEKPACAGARYLFSAFVALVAILVLISIVSQTGTNGGFSPWAILGFAGLALLMGLLGRQAAKSFLDVTNNTIPPEKVIGIGFSMAVMVGAIILLGALLIRLLTN
jgi:hypothetical protein